MTNGLSDRQQATTPGPSVPQVPQSPSEPVKSAVLTTKRSFFALASGVMAGILIAGHTPGLGVLLFVVGFTAAWIALERPTRSFNLIVFGSLSVALYAMAFVRGTNWLVTLDILFATLLLPLATSQATSLSDIGRTIKGWGAQVPWSVVPVVRRAPRLDLSKRVPNLGVVKGVAFAFLPLLIFGTLFASADRVFSDLLDSLVPSPSGFTQSLGEVNLGGRLFVGVVTAGAVGALYLSMGIGNTRVAGGETVRKRLEPVEWITALVLIDLLFAVFVAVQLTVLFGGRSHIFTTEGLTYAQYARSGFYQLVMVSVLVLGLIALVLRWAKQRSPRHTALLRGLLGTLCALTVVVLASALYRIDLLEETFGLTRIRLFGHAGSLWIGGLFVLVTVAGIRWRADWLPRAVVTYSALFLLGFSLLNPEGTIASYNVDRFNRTGEIDTVYLATLGDDALPALSRLPEPERSCAIDRYYPEPDPLLATNLARRKARATYREIAPTLDGSDTLDQPGNCALNSSSGAYR